MRERRRPIPPTDLPADEVLVAEAQRGRKAAFDVLAQRYHRRATSVSYRLLGDMHDALEVTQEALIRAFQKLDSLEDGARFGPWFLRIVTNLSLNFRRDRSVGGKRVSLDALPPGDPSVQIPDEDGRHGAGRPDAALSAAELARIAEEAIHALPESQRLALVLFSIEQLPQRDVAAIMNCSVEAVKWHVFQARRRLREKLAEFLE